MLPLVRRGAEVAPLSREAERRVLGFINPGLPDRFGATHTLWAGFQYVLPGEVAPAHRHSPAAIRFVIEGRGAFTTVDGDKCVMETRRPGPDAAVDVARPRKRQRPADALAGRPRPADGQGDGGAVLRALRRGGTAHREAVGRLRAPVRDRPVETDVDDVDGPPLPAAQLQVGPDGRSLAPPGRRSPAPPARSTTWRWSTSTRTPAAR